MNVREMISEKPGRVALGVGALLLLSIAFVIVQFRSLGHAEATRGKAFFTIDDGKTWFADDGARIPPFQKDGKPAVLAHVYRAADGTKFVNHLERFRAEAKRALEQASQPTSTGPVSADQSAIQAAYMGGREVKRPGDAKWVNAADFREAQKITSIKCPDGKTQATRIEP